MDYIAATAQGDFGESFKYRGKAALEVIGGRVMPTLILFGLGELIAIVVGLLLGAYTGWRRGGVVDYAGNGVSLILYSMPYFLLGMILLVIFASNLGWFPTSGMLTLGANYDSWFDQAADFTPSPHPAPGRGQPGLIGQYSILMRSSVIETRSDDYVQTARGQGAQGVAHPALARRAQRAAADGLADRHQHRLHHRRRHHRRGRLQLARPRAR